MPPLYPPAWPAHASVLPRLQPALFIIFMPLVLRPKRQGKDLMGAPAPPEPRGAVVVGLWNYEAGEKFMCSTDLTSGFGRTVEFQGPS